MTLRIENCVDAGASLLLAGAVLFAVSALGLPVMLATGWAMLAFLLSFWLLGSLGGMPNGFSVSSFAPAAFAPDPPELLLEGGPPNSDEISTVVRLFDPPAAPPAAPPDDSQALYDALIQLRRQFIRQS